uniref:SNF1-related protein kinase catalytic subunit alpha KIN10-like n=1 Tax=Erigeron canadensis TaxID=72917 RepID=UPI001CB9D145|nr:SNF1-related protein kinase catalytic subunit alpha KIN10-like [Erigeron canadensis]
MEGTSGWESLAAALSNYKLGRTLGFGAFGIVKEGRHKFSGIKVAIKILERHFINDLDDEKVKREINIMRLLSHPHIVRLYEVIETRPAIFVIMEYMDSGELFYHITEKGRLEEAEALHFIQQIISGVESCHLHKVVHRDIKPENLLLDSKGNVKVADFGLANIMRDGHFHQTSCGSHNYAAPEVISGSLYAGPEIDIWSCGVVLYALLSGTLPFDDGIVSVLHSKIKSGIFACPSYLSLGARDLIKRMLIVDQVKRISIPEIYKHPWFQIDLPKYIAVNLVNTPWCEKEIDIPVLEEMGVLGFNVQEVIASLNKSLQNQATVTYSMLLTRSLNSHGYDNDNLQESLSPKSMERREVYVRPIPPVHGNWVLGFKSSASPHETMRHVFALLKFLNVRWKKIGSYNIKCMWKPAVRSYTVPMRVHKLTLREDTTWNAPIKSSLKEKFSLYEDVKFEIQLYRANADSYVLDWQRVSGTPFLFMELCARFHACVIA